MLDLVPFAGSRREVAHMDRHAELVGEPLKLVLPDVRAIAITAAGVGVDENIAGVGVVLRPDLRPPSSAYS